MTTFPIIYDRKAEKQYQALDTDSQKEIDLAIKQDELLNYGKLRRVNSFYWVSSKRYRILVHVEPSDRRMMIFDIRLAKD